MCHRTGKKEKIPSKAQKAIDAYHSKEGAHQDPSGSYSGTPKKGDQPEQDADDL